LNKNSLYAILLLTVIWVILRESITIPEAAAGIVISTCCVFFCRRLLPFSNFETINLLKLAVYPFYLIGQVYLAGFNAIKLILTDADADIIKVKTQISNSLLRTILANSITLIPGSISLELQDETITVLWLKGKSKDSRHALSEGEAIKGKLEKILLKAEG